VPMALPTMSGLCARPILTSRATPFWQCATGNSNPRERMEGRYQSRLLSLCHSEADGDQITSPDDAANSRLPHEKDEGRIKKLRNKRRTLPPAVVHLALVRR